MMPFDERLGWLLLGCFIGFVLGYIVRSLREIKEELEEVDRVVKNQGEGGFVRIPIIQDVALLAVVVLTVWAAFSSQRASNDIQDTQDDVTRVAVCSQTYLSKTIRALNERTTYVGKQAQANVNLQKAQLELLQIAFVEPPPTDAEGQAALKRYFNVLQRYVEVNGQIKTKAESYPYPTNDDLSTCLHPD